MCKKEIFEEKYGCNLDLFAQIKLLHEILKKNTPLYNLLEKAAQPGLADYYVGAGCIAQTVWNYQNHNDLMYGISDFDFVYFDDKDLSLEKEIIISQNVKSLVLGDFEIDVKNEARVHLWYKSHFGYEIEPYASLEAAINSWPSTATAIGVRLQNGNLTVYAPFGLNDMFNQTVKANKAQIIKEIYEIKTSKWSLRWPSLRIIPW